MTTSDQLLVELSDGEFLLVDTERPPVRLVMDTSPEQELLVIASGPEGISADTVQELVDESVQTHIYNPTPHPAYDDMPSLVLIFENGLI